MHENTLKAVKRKYRKPISDKALTAITLHAQGLSKTEAVRRAGYSESVQRVPKQVFTGQALINAVDKFKLELKDQGLTTDYWAAKFAEWAKKGNIKQQQETYKLYKEVALDSDLKKPEDNIKRTFTLTEYLDSGTKSPENTLKSVDSTEDDESTIELKPYISDIVETEPEDIKEEEGELII